MREDEDITYTPNVDVLFWPQDIPIMRREYAEDAPDEPWSTFMVRNRYCPIDTEKDTIYLPNVRHRVPYINIPEKPTVPGKETDKDQEKTSKRLQERKERDVVNKWLLWRRPREEDDSTRTSATLS